ncbi:putative calcium-transporting ATPase 13, plasma membrane-type [Humulus lupulus]|uniref:putative calcium-transporting ATPase 13, plasma membrane-type n=1 Tax=Humulus lupulus TaxID=3486 RepID=UPI002B414912|nr:putative calcium-transporting ATPase 13, plasma membrane-type [Humulus lupulus]
MSLRSGKLLQTAMHEHELETGSPSKSHKRRWRLAFMAISFTRALRFLAKNVHENKANLLRSLSYVAIDVQPSADADDKPAGNEHLSFLDNIDPKDLADIVRAKNFDSLMSQYGGVERLVETLETDVKSGISSTNSDLLRRKIVFGANEYRKQPVKGFLSFVYDAFKDTVIIILLVCALLSLGFGIKQHGLKDGWFDGGSIIFAVFLVVVVSAVSNFNQSRQFQKLSTKSSDISVEVVRNGRRQPISIFDIVVGDVVCLKIGDQIPADGLFLKGHSLKVDESSMTGESDHVEINAARNPFLLSGTKVADGFCTMLVTSVGMNTVWGEMTSSVSRDLDEETPLQARLEKMTSLIGKVGLSVAALVLVVLMARYFTGHTTDDKGLREFNGSKTKFDDIMNVVLGIIAAAVTIVVVAIPEGLPLAVTLTLAYSMKRMMKDNAMVRKLSACETMGSATTICTDKTGTLTLNEMKVTEVWLGKEPMSENSASQMSPTVVSLLQESIGLNTTGSVYKPSPESAPEISGSPTEKAILSWAVFSLGLDMDAVTLQCDIIKVEAFNSEKKMSGVLIRRKHEQTLQAHWKGAAEIVLAMCSNYYDRDGVIRPINNEERKCIETNIQNMAAKSLRCIAFAHRELEGENGQVNEKNKENGLTLLGVAGLKDPCRPEVKVAVETCIAAGVSIKMITGDNVHTARAIAIDCGILKPDKDLESEAIVEGVQFRNYSPEERREKVERIRIMARSSPFDKLLMVQCLKQKGHVVAVTGDGTNDAPALKEADIGLSMGIQGTEVAKESSDIIILDDNFNSVVTVLKWGRCVYNNIQKFIQFQLTVNVAALVINFVAAVSSGKVPLTAVQLLWVNLIMDTLAALALATEQPTNELMKKPPVGRKESLITRIMWRNLIAHALFQVTVLLTLQFKGRSIFGVDEKVKNTLIFNTFVLCQVFNEFNARKLEKKNIFKGIHKNKLFLGIIGITILLQVLMVEFLKKFASTERLSWAQWGASISIAALSWPIGWLVKCIPVSGTTSRLQQDSACD